MSRVAKHPLDPAAVAAADAAIAERTGGRALTAAPSDAELRQEWMDAYLAAGGAEDDEDWGDDEPDQPTQGCTSEFASDTDPEYRWFFSA